MSDCDLLRRYIADRDERAYSILVAKHQSMVLSICSRALRDRHLAEDAAQMVFWRLVRAAPDLHNRPLVPWLCRTATYVSANMRRARAARLRRERSVFPAHVIQAPHDPKLDWPEMGGILTCLCEKEREAIVLRYMQDRSIGEISNCLGISVDAVKKRLSRGVHNLRQVAPRFHIEP